jgi:bifunctional DNA primase/polymerase-like protein
MNRRLMAAAYELTTRGWFVFPLRSYDKRPVRGFTRWEERATRDPQSVYHWWSDGPYNIGVATGPSSLVVIDCDAGRGDTPPSQWAGARDGLDVLARLARERGERISATLSVRTPSGGLHLYFRAPGGISLGNTTGKLGWHIDTRGIGGYVVGPGSVGSAGAYTILRERAIAPLPGWMTEALAPKASIDQDHATAVRSSAGYIRTILRGESDRIRTAEPGTRNNALNMAAFRLGQLVGRGELTEQEAMHILTDGASVHVGIHGFTESEMHRTIQSGLTAGQRC